MWKPESIPELILQASSKEQNKMELSLLTNTTYPFSWSILMFLWLLDAILVRLVRLVMRCVIFRLGHILSVRRKKKIPLVRTQDTNSPHGLTFIPKNHDFASFTTHDNASKISKISHTLYAWQQVENSNFRRNSSKWRTRNRGTKRAHETYRRQLRTRLLNSSSARNNNGHEGNRYMELQTLIQGFGEAQHLQEKSVINMM
jgi:hypothetical protein